MKSRSIEHLIDDQVRRWELQKGRPSKERNETSVITVSREPGSGGRIVAKRIAERLGLDLFHSEIMQEVARNARISTRLVETLDEKGLSLLEDWISTLVNERHLWPDQYLQHLMKVIITIGRHGRAVIVGRGANYILPPEGRFRVRIVAPLEIRVKNVAREYKVPVEEARRRVLRTESERKAFVRKYFHSDISDPIYYDLVINTGEIPLDVAVETVAAALGHGRVPE
ncbi:MAG: cytidylate kinase-like family protein, partial [Deltaproteobacteria bacterium]|nr:cytidylate kinase-like family protein [Deltaproteobacteria bacterium]